MKPTTQQQLILSLIKDDMINSTLVNGLSAVGLNAESYFLHLSTTIFELMEIPDTDATAPIFERYVQLTKKAAAIPIHQSHAGLDELAKEIYQEIKQMKRRLIK
jgi:hypothetical protein